MQSDRPRRKEHDLSAIERMFESDLPNSKLAEHCPGGNVDERSGGSSRALVFVEAANFSCLNQSLPDAMNCSAWDDYADA
jgi:hypothetical protein